MQNWCLGWYATLQVASSLRFGESPALCVSELFQENRGAFRPPAPSGARVKLVHKTEPWGTGLVNIHSFLFVFQVLITRISLKCNKQCGLFGWCCYLLCCSDVIIVVFRIMIVYCSWDICVWVIRRLGLCGFVVLTAPNGLIILKHSPGMPTCVKHFRLAPKLVPVAMRRRTVVLVRPLPQVCASLNPSIVSQRLPCIVIQRLPWQAS